MGHIEVVAHGKGEGLPLSLFDSEGWGWGGGCLQTHGENLSL